MKIKLDYKINLLLTEILNTVILNTHWIITGYFWTETLKCYLEMPLTWTIQADIDDKS